MINPGDSLEILRNFLVNPASEQAHKLATLTHPILLSHLSNGPQGIVTYSREIAREFFDGREPKSAWEVSIQLLGHPGADPFPFLLREQPTRKRPVYVLSLGTSEGTREVEEKLISWNSEFLVYSRPDLTGDEGLLEKQASEIANFLIRNKKAKNPEIFEYPIHQIQDAPSYYTTFKCKRHESATHDFFVSYRVRADGQLARYLAADLNMGVPEGQRQFTAFLDTICLPISQDWQESFLSGLMGSKAIILLISNEALNGIKEAHKKSDNMLLEFDYALQRLSREKDKVMLIPVWVGSENQGYYKKFERPKLDEFPDIRHCHPRAGPKTVREIMSRIYEIQGIPHIAVLQIDGLVLQLKAEFIKRFK